jgi:hypothetical protein
MANTSDRYIYLNDNLQTVLWPDYQNQNINFTEPYHTVMAAEYSAGPYGHTKGKAAHVFLDYTYRDLSVESNRRLFIDSNGGSTPPATLSALNPILYFPMTDGYSVGENIGTGGDFTANGSPSIINRGTEYVAGSGDGGMVWFKDRNVGDNHYLYDTERGITKQLMSNATSAESTTSTGITAVNTDGYTMGTFNGINRSGYDFASWTFRKAERFFDVVTYTGDDTAGREIAHNLGCEVGMMFIKDLDNGKNWMVYHKDIANTEQLYLNTGAGVAYSTSVWNSTTPTSTEFTLGTHGNVNSSASTYVAYLFAHDPVGEDNDGMIACGSYTGNGASVGVFQDIGWEPQWILTKNTNLTNEQWHINDSMRGVTADGLSQRLEPSTSGTEASGTMLDFKATGFTPYTADDKINGSGNNYIYMAIRAPMMKEPESGTEVFKANYGLNASADGKAFEAGFPVDMYFRNNLAASSYYLSDRMRGGNKYLTTQYTGAETTLAYSDKLDNQTGVYTTSSSNYSAWMCWMFKRAKGFFDVVAYTGNVTAGRTVNHSLSVVPEMMWVKARGLSQSWSVFSKDIANSESLLLDLTWAKTSYPNDWNSTSPTDSVFSVGTDAHTNANNYDYIAYLFATLEGVSKVGSYTGNGSSQNIACGFSGGARFVLIKCIDGGDWYVWDTERGIVTGNDPHLSLNTATSPVTSDDSIDPYSTGFTVNQVAATSINSSTGTYIFLAIA